MSDLQGATLSTGSVSLVLAGTATDNVGSLR
jgi:hypothetical protein